MTNMKHKIMDEYTILQVYYQQEKKYFDVIIDTEDLDKFKDTKIFINCRDGQYRPKIYNGSYYRSLQSFLVPSFTRCYSKNGDPFDCRKKNITSKTSEVIGLNEKRGKSIKEAFTRMSKESKENIIKGIRENRYSKQYSTMMQQPKIGEKNTQAILTWELVNQIRAIATEGNVSQSQLGAMFNVSRTAIADILNYRTWTIIPELNERVYKETNKRLAKNVSGHSHIRFSYDDISFDNILFQFEYEYIYVEKLSLEGLVYIEQRSIDGKFLGSTDVYIPKYKNGSSKKFYIIGRMNPKAKGRAYFYEVIDRAFEQIALLGLER